MACSLTASSWAVLFLLPCGGAAGVTIPWAGVLGITGREAPEVDTVVEFGVWLTELTCGVDRMAALAAVVTTEIEFRAAALVIPACDVVLSEDAPLALTWSGVEATIRTDWKLGGTAAAYGLIWARDVLMIGIFCPVFTPCDCTSCGWICPCPTVLPSWSCRTCGPETPIFKPATRGWMGCTSLGARDWPAPAIFKPLDTIRGARAICEALIKFGFTNWLGFSVTYLGVPTKLPAWDKFTVIEAGRGASGTAVVETGLGAMLITAVVLPDGAAAGRMLGAWLADALLCFGGVWLVTLLGLISDLGTETSTFTWFLVELGIAVDASWLSSDPTIALTSFSSTSFPRMSSKNDDAIWPPFPLMQSLKREASIMG